VRPLERTLSVGAALAAVVLGTTAAGAEPSLAPASSPSTTAAPADSAEPKPTPAQKRAPYSLPWGLRPAIAPNLLRLDTVVAPADDGTTVASILTGGGKPFAAVPDLGFYGRGAIAYLASDDAQTSAVSNPLLGVLYTPEVAPGLRVAGFGGTTIPIGQGGGDDPDLSARAALAAASRARCGLDGVLFASNYAAVVGGLDVAYLTHGFSLQAETTIVGAFRARGETVEEDAARAAFTGGLHVGYLLLGLVNLSVEARAQVWLSDAAPVRKDETAREQLSLGGGARFNVELSDTVLARPGLAYSAGLDAPMSENGVHVIQVDLPVTF
jgi:hypothetical protein